MSKTKILCYFPGCCIAVFTFIPVQSQSQDLGDEHVLVVKAYQPVLTDAYKINDLPLTDTSRGTVPVLSYEIENRRMQPAYKPTPIKPVKIKDDSIRKLYRGYVKGGYGNYSTYYGEFMYNALRSKEFDAGVHYRHLSGNGKIKGYGIPAWSDNLFELSGRKFMESATLDASFSYQRLVQHFYGYESPPFLFSKKETRHRFNDFNGRVSYGSNYKEASDRLDYKASLTYTSFADNLDNTEGRFGLEGFAGMDFNGHYGKLGLKADFSEYKQAVPGTTNRTFVSLQPRYLFHADLVNLEAGANVEAEFEDATTFHLYPFLKAKYQLIDDAMSVYAEWKGSMQQNYFRELSLANPFMDAGPQLKNTNVKFDLGGGINIRLDHDVKTGLSASFQRKLNEPFFVNIMNLNYPVTFKVEYYDVNVLNIHAEVSYDFHEKLMLGLQADYQKFSNNNGDRFWYKPAMRVALSGGYAIGEKILIKTDWFYNSQVEAKSDDVKGYTTLKGWLDLNLGGEYIYKKNLSVFLKLNNLASQRYRQYYQYPTYRINLMGGLTYSF